MKVNAGGVVTVYVLTHTFVDQSPEGDFFDEVYLDLPTKEQVEQHTGGLTNNVYARLLSGQNLPIIEKAHYKLTEHAVTPAPDSYSKTL